MEPALMPTVAGSWAYEAPGLTGTFFGTTISCDYELVMEIPRTGSTFDGLYHSALLVCALTGEPQIADLGGGTVVGGSLLQDSVHFDFDSDAIHNAGTIAGDRMSGSVEIELVVQVNAQIDTVVVAGGWSARR